MECLQELESTFDYGKELQKRSAVVAVKLRETMSTLRLKVEQKSCVRVILVVLSRLWGGGVADRGTGKGADFLAKNIIIEYGFNLLVLSRCTCELC